MTSSDNDCENDLGSPNNENQVWVGQSNGHNSSDESDLSLATMAQ